MKRYLPYLHRNDSASCRWIFGWALPGMYITAAHWLYEYSRERKLLIDLGRKTPAKRQIHLTMVTLLDD